jgi:hypothetical protein
MPFCSKSQQEKGKKKYIFFTYNFFAYEQTLQKDTGIRFCSANQHDFINDYPFSYDDFGTTFWLFTLSYSYELL